MIVEEDARDLAEQMKSYERLTAGSRRGMNQRLRVRYRFGRSGYSRVIFTARDIPDLARRLFYLEAINRSDLHQLKQGQELIGMWSQARRRLEAKQAHLDGLKELGEEQRQSIETDKLSLEQVLAGVRRERRQHEAALAELNRGASRLMGVIAGLDQKRTAALEQAPETAGPAGAFAALRGGLCYPAAGPVLIGYGKRVHPEFNTETMHNGIEIGAPQGAKVHAVSDGVVRFAEWFRGYGNLVILDHGDGYYTVYAHLAGIDVRVGQEVKTGQTIGVVGDTGSMEGASLYFEVRHHQKPENPAGWLGGCAH
jgi:septal ring factor EnvC (AmiA/AmiB activator)